MSGKRRSLADDLNDLFNPAPAPELDPETAGVDLPVLNEIDEELTKHVTRRPSRAAKEKSLLFRGDIQLDDGVYKGRKTTRAAMFGGDADEDDDEADGGPAQLAGLKFGRSKTSEEGDEDESSGEDEDMKDEDEDELEQRRASGSAASSREAAGGSAAGADRRTRQPSRAAAAAAAAVDHVGTVEPDEVGESGDEDEDDEDDRRTAGNPETQQLDAEYRALQEAEQAAFVGLRERAEKERAKGRAVAAQQRVYERALEARILLQKCVAGGNRMPRAGDLAGVLAASGALREGYDELRASALQTLSSLLQLHSALVDNNPAIRQAAPPVASATAGAAANGSSKPGDKRSRAEDRLENLEDSESAWRALEGQWEVAGPFRDASLDRWHRRTMLATGGAALKSGGLKALHQSVSAQVANLVRDNAKAVKRTRLTLSARPRVLCGPTSTPAGSAAPAPTSTASEVQEDPDEAQDPETFDDAEFYQQLLKELIDGSAAQAGVGGQKGPKKRKNVDRRASKGRKIRYQVHEKLVNFVAPADAEVPLFAAQLFANLFGRSK